MFLWLSTASAGMSAASSAPSPAGMSAASSAPAPAGMSAASSAPAPARPLRAVLFDIDGTLFNSDEVHLEVFAEMLAQRGFNGGKPIDEEFFLERISGRSNPAICADLFPTWSDAEATAFSDAKEARFRELAAARLSELRTRGLDALLAWLDERQIPAAAVTNAPRANAELMLNAIGRLSWFKTLVIGDECEHAKPHPEPYEVAMRTLGVEPGDCVAFEDSPSGARAAVAAGVATLGILSTQPAAALEAAGCEASVADFTDAALLGYLEQRARCREAL